MRLKVKTIKGRNIFEQVSNIVKNVNRLFTDINFSDVFRIPEQGRRYVNNSRYMPKFSDLDFCLELTIYCRRTDASSQATGVSDLTRTLGQTVSRSVKRQLSSVGGTLNARSGQNLLRDLRRERSKSDNGKENRNNLWESGHISKDKRGSERMLKVATTFFQVKNTSLGFATQSI